MRLDEKNLGFMSATAQRHAEDVWEAICAVERGPFTIDEITDEIYEQYEFRRVGKKGQEKTSCINKSTLRKIVAAVLKAVEAEGHGIVSRLRKREWMINDAK